MSNGKRVFQNLYEKKAAEEMERGVAGEPGGEDESLLAEWVCSSRVILDIGCGMGRMAYALGEGKELHGLDISKANVESCIRSGYASAKVCDLNTEDIPHEQIFDAGLCLQTLEHLIDPVHALAEINRVLKTDGLLAVSTPNVAFLPCRLALLLGHFTDLRNYNPGLTIHLRFYTFNTLGRLLNSCGFDIVEKGYYPCNPREFRLKQWYKPASWLLARLMPSLFAQDIVLLVQKKEQPAERRLSYPPGEQLGLLERLKRSYRSS